MNKVSYSDLANIPPTVCPSSLDENLEPVDPNNTAHKWIEPVATESHDFACGCGGDQCGEIPVTCSECGTQKDTEAKTTFKLVDAYEYEAHFDDEEKAREAYKTFVASGAFGAKLYAVYETYENGEPTGDFTDEVLLSDEL